MSSIISRAHGCFLGQLAGDSMGGLVEFMSKEDIALSHPHGFTNLQDGGVWNKIAGQATDDSEMALALARSIIAEGKFTEKAVSLAYRNWCKSPNASGTGKTIRKALLRGEHSPESQANGALMRVSPLGIFCAPTSLDDAYSLGEREARLTHINPLCQQINGLYVSLLAEAIGRGARPKHLFFFMTERLRKIQDPHPLLNEIVANAESSKPKDYVTHMGWVGIAFQNALWHLLHTKDIQEAISDTIMQGGDTDTNAAIVGALLGAVYGEEAIPAQWKEKILSCRPKDTLPEYWPVDILELADKLLVLGEKSRGARFKELTKFIPYLKEQSAKSEVCGGEKIGTTDTGDSIYTMPYTNYEREVYQIQNAVFRQIEQYPYLDGFNYITTLKNLPDRQSSSGNKLDKKTLHSFSAKIIFAFLVKIFRGERFCDGSIASAIKSGLLLRLLERLQEIDEEA